MQRVSYNQKLRLCLANKGGGGVSSLGEKRRSLTRIMGVRGKEMSYA